MTFNYKSFGKYPINMINYWG